MRETIRHDDTRTTILAYLATRPCATRSAQIIAYMRLMHRVTGDATKMALFRLAERGLVERVQRGWYALPRPATEADQILLCRAVAARIVVRGIAQ